MEAVARDSIGKDIQLNSHLGSERWGDSPGPSPRLKSNDVISFNDSVVKDRASVLPLASMKLQLTVIPFATFMLTRLTRASDRWSNRRELS